MEFWGVEVKAEEPVEVNPENMGKCIHLSQAALGEAKKDKASEPVVLYLKFGEQKLVLGTLSQDKFPHLSYDLVLEKKFELSHNWKNGSVYFCGYKAELAGAGSTDLDDDLADSEDDEDLPLTTKDNAKPDIKTEVAKAAASKSNDVKLGEPKKQVKVVEPKRDEDESEDEDEEDDESDDENDSSDEDMVGGDLDSDDESDSDEDDDDKTPPKKATDNKKRTNESGSKTPVPAKKAKSATPQKTDGKKPVHVATPYPLKKGGKTPKNETKDQTPKSGGQFSCKSCSRSFNSEDGLQQHSKAKHSGQ